MYRLETVLLSLALAILIASPRSSRGQTKSPQAHRDTAATTHAKAEFSEEPYVIELARTALRFENDGTSQRISSLRIHLQSDSAVEKFRQLDFSFNAANEKVEVRRIVVHKRDGTTLTVPQGVAKEGPAQANDGPASLEEKEMRVAVPGLVSGDTLEYEVATRIAVPFAATQFWTEQRFIRDAIALDEQVELNLPGARQFSLKAPGYRVLDGKVEPNQAPVKGVSFSRSDEGGRTVLRWHRANLVQSSGDDQQRATEETHRSPDIQLTTFRNWEEVARWEAELWKDKVQPSAEVTEKAAEITKGLTTQDEKARALYGFVSKNLRFVNSSFGSEHFRRRSATEILASQYADSADSHVLLAALLNAAGITADAALMPATGKLDASLPSPAQLERVLTVIPDGMATIWLDPTAEVAPFGFLPAPLRGQSAVLIGSNGSEKIVKTPLDPPFASAQAVEIEASVSDLGKLSGTIHYSVRGDAEFVLRTAFHRTPQSQWNELARTILTLDGLHGDVDSVKASAPADTENPFELHVKFSQQSFLEWPSKTTRTALPLLTIGMPDVPAQGDREVQLGTPLNVITRLVLKFPAQFSVEAPVGTEAKRDYAEFRSGYRFENGVLTADRSLNFKLREISPARVADYRAFTDAVSADEAQLLTVDYGGSQPGVIPVNASADDIFDAGTAALKTGNVSAAIPLFQRVTEIDPKHAHAWNDLGVAYLRAGKREDAVAAFRKQLEMNPADENANNYLGVALEQERRYDEAAAAFNKQIALNPLDTIAHGALGTIRLEQHDEAAAVPELEKAAILSPKSAELEVSLGRAYLGVSENQKALDAFHKAITLSPTTSVRNNVAYNLAEHNLDLDEALEYANAAVKAGNESLANVTLARATPTDVTHSHDLAAYWDTLGWVYFRKGDLAKAERYVASAFLVSSRAASCDHLAQIYEKRGEKDRAAHTYALALSMPDADPETRARLMLLLGGNSQIDALVAKARDDFAKTLRLAVKPDSSENGTAEFLILLSAHRTEEGASLAHVEDVKFVTGSESLRPVAGSLRSLNYGAIFPAVSTAKLVVQGQLTCPGPGNCSFTLSPAAASSVH